MCTAYFSPFLRARQESSYLPAAPIMLEREYKKKQKKRQRRESRNLKILLSPFCITEEISMLFGKIWIFHTHRHSYAKRTQVPYMVSMCSACFSPLLRARQENSYLSATPIMLEREYKKKGKRGKTRGKRVWKPSDGHSTVLIPCDGTISV